jgi:hypothetical protein
MARETRRKLLAALAMLIVGPPAIAQDSADQLFGSWRLLSFKAQIVGEDAEPRDFFGPSPFGRLNLTPTHKMAAPSVPTGSQTTHRRRGGGDLTAFYDGLHRAPSS